MILHVLVRDNARIDRCKIVINAEQKPANEYVRRYNRLSCFDGAALIPGHDDGMIGKREIQVRKLDRANLNGNELLERASTNHGSYSPLSHFILYPNFTDEFRFEARE